MGDPALALPHLDSALGIANGGDLAGALPAATVAVQDAQRCRLPPGSYRRRLAGVQAALGDLRAVEDLRRLADDERAGAGIALDTALALARALAPARRDAVADVLVGTSRRAASATTTSTPGTARWRVCRGCR